MNILFFFSLFFGGGRCCGCGGYGVDGSLIIIVGVFGRRFSHTVSLHKVVRNSVFPYPVTGHRELNFGRINVTVKWHKCNIETSCSIQS